MFYFVIFIQTAINTGVGIGAILLAGECLQVHVYGPPISIMYISYSLPLLLWQNQGISIVINTEYFGLLKNHYLHAVYTLA